MSSDDDAGELMAAFRRGGTARSGANNRTSTPQRLPVRPSPAKKRASTAVEDFVSDSSSAEEHVATAEPPPKVRRLLQIRPKPVQNREEYTYYEPQDEVESIVRESTKRGELAYEVRLVGGEIREVSEAATIQ